MQRKRSCLTNTVALFFTKKCCLTLLSPASALRELTIHSTNAMTAPQRHSLFNPEPHYIPGYGGFYPQFRYQIGETYGKTTSHLLTDPSIQKSPCSVLAPLVKPKFLKDFSDIKHPLNQMLDRDKSYIPGYTGFIPYQKPQVGMYFPIPAPESNPALSRLVPAKEQQLLMNTDTGDSLSLCEKNNFIPCHPGIRLACGHGWKSLSCPPGKQLISEQEEKKSSCDPDIALACGQEKSHGPCHSEIALACGQGWNSFPCLPRIKEPVRIEAVALPAVTEAVDVSRYSQLPQLDVPNLIQRKAISGYTGFIPRFTWIMGVNYLKGVKEAMNEFDINQHTARNPMCTSNNRLPQTYWPNKRIYTNTGLIPFYTGFVPTIRNNYMLTFGNSSRKAYQKQKQQAHAF
ncbi:ciliary microtubule inner protein 2A isoform X1 [Alligator mississippiensis]|uniref:ciliary microtubule inner protein 2A isoform X1 n=1 Tax=Alligator mississippiensis TaxID=8496 RepID=UPI000711E654|nr:ciliary microtubule inner protein 2A isoform X1 [Alligator mississippiensis]